MKKTLAVLIIGLVSASAFASNLNVVNAQKKLICAEIARKSPGADLRNCTKGFLKTTPDSDEQLEFTLLFPVGHRTIMCTGYVQENNLWAHVESCKNLASN